MEFEGFPEAGLKFLDDLSQNNNKEWFTANKEVYQENLLEPAKAFVQTLGQELMELSGGIRYDMRTNGGGSLMRIYRDTRFSKDKTPYKTNVSGMFWEGSGKKTESPGMGFQLETSGMHLMTGMFQLPKPWLVAYRDAIIDDLGEELEQIVEEIGQHKTYQIRGEQTKRVPRGYDKEHPREALLRHKSIYIHPPQVTTEHLSSPELVDICLDHFQTMLPLHHWLVKLSTRL